MEHLNARICIRRPRTTKRLFQTPPLFQRKAYLFAREKVGCAVYAYLTSGVCEWVVVTAETESWVPCAFSLSFAFAFSFSCTLHTPLAALLPVCGRAISSARLPSLVATLTERDRCARVVIQHWVRI